MNSEQIVAQADAVRVNGLALLAFDKQPSVRMLPPMPILVAYHPAHVAVSVEMSGESVLFSLHGDSETLPMIDNCIDAHQVRDAFLGVKTPAEALTWFAASGHFRNLYEDDNHTLTTVTWGEFQLWQEFLSALLRQGLAAVLKKRHERTEEEKQDHSPFGLVTYERFEAIVEEVSDEERRAIHGYPDGLHIASGSLFRYRDHPEPKPLVAELQVWSALEAMLATVYVDQITGIKFQACSLRDCSQLFEVSSKHERQYCSQACAHKASVRKRRAEEKRLKEAVAAKQTIKSKAKKGKG